MISRFYWFSMLILVSMLVISLAALGRSHDAQSNKDIVQVNKGITVCHQDQEFQQVSQAAEDDQEVFLVIEDDHLIGCNGVTGKFAEVRLQNNENVLEHMVANLIAIVVTNKRFLAFSSLTDDWHIVNRRTAERFLDLQASSSRAVVLTSKRIMTFNGRKWFERSR